MDAVKSRFSNSFIGKVVASGSKVQGSAYPTLTVASTKDKFVLNQKALALMGLDEGAYVVMIDSNRGSVTTGDPNARWYLTAGWDKGKGNFEGAKIGKGGSFSYSGVYSAIQMNDPNIAEASIKDMAAAGKGILREAEADEDGKKKLTFIATQKVTFNVKRLVEGEEGEEITEFDVATGIKQAVYCLTEMEVVAHTPRTEGDDDDTTPAE